MKIQIKVYPNAKHEKIKSEGKEYKIYVTASAIEGKANKAVIKLLAKHFNVRKNGIEIIKGLKSRYKTIIIVGNHLVKN